MTKFENFTIIPGRDKVLLSAESYVQYDKEETHILTIGTPKCWDDLLCKKIELSNYSVYSIYTHTVLNGMYNRITDHKKIWGLRGIAHGVFDDSYITAKGKVYFGISKGEGAEAFLSSKASLIILAPKNQNIHYGDLFALFKTQGVDFDCALDPKLQACIQQSLPNSYLLYYHIAHKTTLLICGHSAESLFGDIDCEGFTGMDMTPVYRKS